MLRLDRKLDWQRFRPEEIAAAADRLQGVTVPTPLRPWPSGDPLIELRLKLENRQEVKAFKARGAWNQIAQLSTEEKRVGVVAASSGNHGQAVAWAAKRAGVAATIVMPEDAYPNKIAACRAHGANVVLTDSREAADDVVAERVAEGRILIHPFDAERTVYGAGTVGLEIAREWPEVEVVVFPVGGGGLIAGSSLALRSVLGDSVKVVAVEPAGAPNLTLGLAASRPIAPQIDTVVQGLCPVAIGHLNLAICQATVDHVLLLEDRVILDSQRELVLGGEVVEPAGAAAPAAVLAGMIPETWTRSRDKEDPLRVAAVVSGGNPDPSQLDQIRSSE